MDLVKHFNMFAAYNRWANNRLYDTATTLTDAQYRTDAGVFFKSMRGTLNHILVGDRVWMQRFTGNGPAHTKLDDQPYDDLPALRAAREAEDARIIDYVASLTGEALACEFEYVPITDPTPVRQKLAPALAHFFNHQTHHRGHAHGVLTILTGDAPPLDLIYFQRETGIGF